MSAAALPHDSSTRSTTGGVWAGCILSVLVTLFLLFDCSIKIARARAAVDGTVQLGYPQHLVAPIGLALLVCVILYLIPRTAVLGAILMTRYLGGATATMVRVEHPWLLFPAGVGVLAWLGLYLRDEGLRAVVGLDR
ncbi:MAG TPA: DoxX family protein [Terriglobales bacterium]|nr:DoxX family protein [Terriglobales bacterium]